MSLFRILRRMAHSHRVSTRTSIKPGLEILEDRFLPTSLNGVVLVSEPESVTTPKVAVTLDDPSSSPVTVNYAVTGGTAVASSDYSLPSGSLTFQPGSQVQFLPISIVNHTINEPNKTVIVSLSSSSNAALSANTLVYTILNDVATPTVSFAASTPTQGPQGTNAVLTVNLSAASAQTATIQYGVTGGSAVAGTDYKTVSGTLTFMPGQTTQTFTLPTLNDGLYQNNRTVQLTLSNPTNASLSANPALTYTIENVNAAPSVGFSQTTASGVEGQIVNLPVVLSKTSGAAVTLMYAASGGTAASGTDFTLPGTSLTFALGQTTQNIPVTLLNTGTVGANKTVVLTLTGPTGAMLGAKQAATLTIGEQLPVIGFTSTAGSGPANQNGSLAVALNVASSKSVTVKYAVSGGTAKNGTDFKLSSGTLTIPAGQTTASIPVTVINHNLNEPNKTIDVTLTAPSGASLGAATTVYTILNTVPAPSVSFAPTNPASVAAGKSVTFTVTLSAPSGQTATVQYAVTGGTAVAGTDYKAAGGTLTFKPGQTKKTISLTTLKGYQPNKTVQLSLSDPANVMLGNTTSWTTTIVETRPSPVVPTVSFTAGNPTSGSEGTSATFTVGLSAATTQIVTVKYAVVGGTGVAGVDYSAISGTLTFSPGQTSKTIALPILNDHLYESSRTVLLGLSSPTNATLGSSPTLTYTIHGTNPAPAVAFSTAAATAAPGETISIPVTLSAVSKDPVTVNVAFGGNAQSGIDYSLPGGSTVTFSPGQQTQNISVILLRTISTGQNRTLLAMLSAPVGATLGANNPLTITLLDSETALSFVGFPPNPTAPTITVAAPVSGTTNQNVTVTGQVADAGGLADIESLKAEVDQTFFPLTFDGSGNFSFTTSLLLNGSADGTHTIQFVATDWLGNVATAAAGSFTLKTQGPKFSISSPANNSIVSSNFTVIGSVADSASTIVSVTAKLDSGAAVPLSMSGSGGFNYTTALALDGSADGVHAIVFTATDASGDVGITTVTFTLHTQPVSSLTLTIGAPASGDTVSETGRLIGSAGTVATQASYTLDGGVSIPLSLGQSGSFDQAISPQPLSAGAHTIVVTATNGSGQSVQQSISFNVSATAFSIGSAGTSGWGQQSSNGVYLEDGTSLVVQSMSSIALGQSKGSRTLSFSVDPQWDATDDATATGDVFEVSLESSTNPEQTLLSSGGSGTALFILPQVGAPQYLPGLVTFDGSQVTIDLTSLASFTSGLLVFQLIGDGDGTGSSINVRNISDTSNSSGSVAPQYRASTDVIDQAGGVITGSLNPTSGVVALVRNERLDPTTGSYVAELRVQNTGATLVSQQIAVAFPGLASGVTLTGPSGTTGSGAAPYISLQNAIPAGGLAAGATSAAVLVTLNDPSLARFALTPEVLAGAAPQLPVLSPVSPITVAPGGYVAIPLQASDTDGGAITYSIGGGALPTGTLEANGTLILQPSPANVGTYNFSVTASDGAAQTSEPISVTVTGSPSATTSVSGTVESTSGVPIAGVPVSLGAISATTNSLGVYTIAYSGSAPADAVVVHGDEMTGSTTYEGFSVPLDQLTNEPIYSGYTNVVGRPTYLTPISTSGAVTVNPRATVTVTAAGNSDVVLTIPAGSLYDQNGNLYSGKIAVSVVPVTDTPAPLPAGMNPPMSIMITAVGSPGTSLYLAKGTLTLPNTAGYKPGSSVDLDVPGATGKPSAIARGTVSTDGKTITFTAFKTPKLSATAPPPDPIYMPDEFDNIDSSPYSPSVSGSSTIPCSCPCGIPGPVTDGGGGLYSSEGSVQSPTEPTSPLETGYVSTGETPVPDNQPDSVEAPYDGTITPDDLSDDGNDPSPFSQLIPINKPQQATGKGALQQQLPVGSYSSQGQSKAFVLSYNSLTADPVNPINLTYQVNGSTASLTNPLLTANVSIHVGDFTEDLPGSSSGNYQSGQGTQFFAMPSSSTAAIGIAANTSNLPTGEYSYTASVGTANDNSGFLTGTTFSTTGKIIVNNNQDSPFGSGWGLTGWEQIVPVTNGSALLIDGDGSRQVFSAPASTGSAYGPPPGDSSTLIRLSNGGWQRTMPDQTVYVFNSQGDLSTITDTNGNVTTFTYDGTDLTSVTDPTGETTTFGYTNGMVSSITTPGGQTTLLSHDSSGNLTQVTLPDGGVQQYGYNSGHELVSSVDPAGEKLTDTYDSSGLIASMSNSAGNSVQVATPKDQYVMPTSETYHVPTAPAAPSPKALIDTITDGNGNVTDVTLNHANEYVSGLDQEGPLETIERTGDLPTEYVDGDGNVQVVSYSGGQVSSGQDSLSLSAITSGSITAPGNQNNYTFTGIAGEAIEYEGFTASSGVTVTLTAPSGTQVGDFYNPAQDDGPFTLAETGTYTLSFTSATTGSYSFEVVNLAQSAPLGLSTPVRATLTPSFGTLFYQISASAGERLEFTSINGSPGSWFAYSPAEGELQNSGTSGDLQVTVGEAGPVYLIVNPGSTAGSFGFEAYAPSTTTATLTLASPETATITDPGDILNYTFSGTAGQHIAWNLEAASLTSKLLAPDGTTAFPNSNGVQNSSNFVLLTLAQTGTYTLQLTGLAPGAYPFELSNVTSLPTAAAGTLINGNLPSSSATALYAIQGVAGQEIEVNDLSSNGITFTLYGVENQVVAGNNPALDDYENASQSFPATFPEGGTYVLALHQSSTAGATDYSFEVTDVTQSSVTPSGFDAWHSGMLASGKTATFTFVGVAGTPIFLQTQGSSTSSVNYEILDQDPKVQAQPYQYVLDTATDDGPVVLPYSGSYTVTVSDYNGSAPYDFEVLDLAKDATALTLGQTITGTLAADQAAIYQFAGSYGQQVLYKAPKGFGTGSAQATVSLASLSNVYSGASFSEYGQSAPDASNDKSFTISAGGTEYLILQNQQSTTTPYTFQLQEFSTATQVNLNTQTPGQFSTTPQTNLYQFSGTAGQIVYFDDVSGTGESGQLFAASADGESTQSWSSGSSFTLPQTGTYYFALAGSGAGTTSYTFELLTPATNTYSLTLGALTSGTLILPDQRDKYTFTGTAGEKVYLSGPTTTGSNYVSAQLTLPDGSTSSSYGLTTLTESGTYTITVTGSASTYQFRLTSVSAATPLPANTQVSDTLQFDGDTALYSFSGSAGQSVSFALGSDELGLSVYSPAGQALNYNYDTAKLPTTGTYLVSLTDYNDSGALDYTLEAETIVQTTTSPMTLGSIYSSTLSIGDAQDFTFTGTAGQQLLFENLNGNDLAGTLTSPSGQSLYYSYVGYNDYMYSLTQSGQYSLSFSNLEGGAYDFEVVDAGSAPAFTLGTPISGSLNPAGSSSVYTFQGNAGQTLAFSDSSDSSIEWELISPEGERIGSSGDSSSLLQEAGLYELVLSSNTASGTPHYDLTITDASQSPVTNTGMDADVSGSLSASQQKSYTFTASAGVPIYFDNEDTSPSPVYFTLTDPTGGQVVSASQNYSDGPYALTESGTYTVEIDNTGTGSTSYSFRVIDLDNAPTITPGTLVSGTLPSGLGLNAYQLKGTAGETLVTDMASLTGVDVGMQQLDGGTTDASQFPTQFTLPNREAEYVTIQGTGTANASYRFEFETVASLPQLTSGTTFTNTSTSVYQVTGTAGEQLYFSGGDGYNITLESTNGEAVSLTEASQNGNDEVATLPAAGTYLLFPITAGQYGSSTFSIPVYITSDVTKSLSLQDGSPGEQVQYDSTFAKPTSITDQAGEQTLYQLDPNTGNVLSVTRVMSSGPNLVTSYTYNSAGQVTTMTDPNGNESAWTYDSLGRITKITYAVGTPLQSSEEYSYDAAGNVLSYTDENGSVTQYQYDSMNRLIKVTEPLGNVTSYTYNADGDMTSMTDPNGNVTSYTYNAEGERTGLTEPNGGATQYFYDGNGNLVETIDPLGNATEYEYDARNRLIATINALGGVTSQTYDAANNVTSMTDADGGTTTYTYDSRNRLVGETDPLGNTTTFQYDADNNLIATIAANGAVTTDVYDAANRLIKVVDPLGNVTQYAYDGDGNEVSMTDPNGHVTTMTYDARNRLISTTDPLGNTTKYTYDANGNLLTATDPLGNVTTNTYDADSRAVKSTDPDDQTQKVVYDADGNVLSKTDQLGQTTTMTYDSMNRVKTMTDALGGVTTYTYNLDGNLVSTKDALGHTTTTVYDALQRTIATINALGGRSSIVYDADGNTVVTTDPNGNTTRYAYDADGRLVYTTNAIGGLTTYKYDRVGNRLTMTDPLGHTATYTYDSDNRLLTTTNNLGGMTTDAYNADGQLTAQTDPLGNTTTYSYDADNRLTAVTNALGGVTSKSYDADGNLISVTDPNGNKTIYAYDKLNRLVTTTNALGGIATESYDAHSNLISLTDPNGNTTTYTYDNLNRLIKITNALGGVTSESYDADGNLTSITDPNGNITTYTYDNLNRLIATTNALDGVTTRTYDADGNLISTTDPNGNTTTYSYDVLNRLLKTTNALAGVRTNTYDADGNIASMTDPNGNTTTYTYDKLNRLVSMTNALGGVTSQTYDADGNVRSRTDPNGNTTTFAYDKLNRRIATTDALGGVTADGYDADSNLISMTDPNGNTTIFSYDKLNRLVKTTNALGGATSQTYDASGNLLTQTGPNGNTTTYTYDKLNRVLATQDPLGNVTTNTYDAVGNLVATTDPNGNTTTYIYDALNRLVKTTDALDGVTTQSYDADGNVVSFTDSDDHTTTKVYDKLNRLVKSTDALGGVTTQTYDADGNLISMTDPLGQTTTYTYDKLNRLLTTTDPLGFSTSLTYDADGNESSSTDANGNSTTYAYDKLNRLLKTTDALGGATTQTYDANGNLLTQTDPMDRTITYTYDKLNRRVSITDPLGNTSTASYDADGNVLASTDALGNTTTYSYDADDRRVTSTDSAGGVTTTVYDSDGNVTSVTDPNGNTTKYKYDGLNRLTATTDPLGNTSTTTYDAVGNQLTATDPLGNITTYSYDALNRQLTVTDPNGKTTSYTYDADGMETSITDPDGNSTSYTYDADNRLVKSTTPLGSETYSYDSNGNLTSTTDADSRTIDYTYDKLNRRTSEIWVNAQNSPIETISYAYDADGEQTSVGDANSADQFTYDADGRVITVSNAGTVGEPIVVMTYSYDKDGNELSRSDTINSQAADALAFAYNTLNELTDETQSGPDASDKRTNFSYDADGNLTGVNMYSDLSGTHAVAATTITFDKDSRITAVTNSSSSSTISAFTYTLDSDGRTTADTTPDGTDAYTYDKDGQLLSDSATGSQANLSFSYDSNGNRANTGYSTGPDNEVLSDGTYNYTYDAVGNLTSQTDIATGAVTLYSYDYRNRLTQVENESSGGVLLEEVKYTYDVFNNRIGETVTNYSTSTPTTTAEVFVYDGSQVAFTFDGNGDLLDSFIYAPGQNQVIAGDNGQGQVLWALSDDQGTVRDIISSAGVDLDHIAYDSFGNITAQSDPSLEFLFGYTGMQFDPVTGLNYDSARFYDAALGRFLTQDPSGFSSGDANLYQYVANDPVSLTDPTGLCPQTDNEDEQLIPADGNLEGPVNGQLQVDQNGGVYIPPMSPANDSEEGSGYGSFAGGTGGGSGSGGGGEGDNSGSGNQVAENGGNGEGAGNGNSEGPDNGERTGNGEGTGESNGEGNTNGDGSGESQGGESGQGQGEQGQGDQNQGDGTTTTDKPLPDGTVEHITTDASGKITNITISSGVSEQGQSNQNGPNGPPPPSTGDTNTDFDNLMNWLGGAANGLKQGAEQGATNVYLGTGALLGNTAAFLTDFGAAAIDQAETAWDPSAAARVDNDLAEAGYFTDNFGNFVSQLPGQIANAPAAAADAYSNYFNSVVNAPDTYSAGYNSLFGPASNGSSLLTGASLGGVATEAGGALLSVGESGGGLGAVGATGAGEELTGASGNLAGAGNPGEIPEGVGPVNSAAGEPGGEGDFGQMNTTGNPPPEEEGGGSTGGQTTGGRGSGDNGGTGGEGTGVEGTGGEGTGGEGTGGEGTGDNGGDGRSGGNGGGGNGNGGGGNGGNGGNGGGDNPELNGQYSPLTPGGGLTSHEGVLTNPDNPAHAYSQHVDVNDFDIFDRAVSNGMDAASRFNSRAEAEAQISNAIDMFGQDNIDKFLNGEISPPGSPNSDRLVITHFPESGNVGTVFSNDFDFTPGNAVQVVLQRGISPPSWAGDELGYTIVTAYPKLILKP